MTSLPVILCVDVEPDERQIDLHARAPWRGFEASCEYFSQLRSRLQEVTRSPVHFNWFLRMDPQVEQGYGSATWTVDHYRSLLSDLESNGDELGLHIHATRWNETAQRWVGDYGDEGWVSECVRSSFIAFENALKRPCESVSLGDRWSSNQTVALVEQLGAKYFLSIEPGAHPTGAEMGYEFTGQWPDYAATPTRPYHPSQEDYTRERKRSARNLWMIPLSAGKYEGEKTFRLWRLKRLAKAVGVDGQRHSESTTLRLHIPPEVFRRVIGGLLNISNVHYLAMVVRSEVCFEQPKRARLEENMEFLLQHPQVSRFRFVRPDEAINLFN